MSTKVKGAKSKVAKGESTGGMITVRLPYLLHKRFANVCIDNKESMNRILLGLIDTYVGDKYLPKPKPEPKQEGVLPNEDPK